MISEQMTRRSFFFDDPLYEALRQLAEKQDMTMSEVVRDAVREKIKNDKRD